MSNYITISEIKKHLNLDADFTDDDQYLETLILVAERAVQRHTCQVLSEIEENGELPKPIKHAIMLLVGDFYNSREGNAFGVTPTEIPHTYEYLLSLFKDYSPTIKNL